MKKHIPLILAVSLLLLPLACATLPNPTAMDVDRISSWWPDAKLSDLQNGRNLYTANCASCHTLYNPGKFTTAQLEKILPKMQRKAKIDNASKDAILGYLKAFDMDSMAKIR